MKIALAQLNPVVGDIEGNTEKIIAFTRKARNDGACIVIFPEQSIVGYPVQDLMFVSGFIEKTRVALDLIRREANDITIIVGFIDKGQSNTMRAYNAAAVLKNGEIHAIVHKQLLPTYDVFDETRYFIEGKHSPPAIVDGHRIGFLICEDLWDDDYDTKVIDGLVEAGADMLVSINASPYYKGKQATREALVKRKVQAFKVPFIYVNMVGGQDEITFDGYSFAMSAGGDIVFRAEPFIEGLFFVDVDKNGNITSNEPAPVFPLHGIEEELFKALSLNLRDYFEKIGAFKRICLGLSGGIDSAFTAMIACNAVGADRVTCIYLPTRFNDKRSHDSSKLLCERLGCEFLVFPIDTIFDEYQARIGEHVEENKFDVSDENLQARIRANILMYYSNKFNWLLVSTGNKSEIATGYCTLYGDTCGGKNLPGDLFKTELVRICKDYINKDKEVIPGFIITRPPSAELRHNQKDEDSLPPYPLLDRILEPMIEEQKSIEDIIAMGFDEAVVRRVAWLVKISEFKRAQLVQTIKVTRKSFGMGRKMPITNGFDYSATFKKK